MIGPNHPVREAFADCSTGNNGGKYYDSMEIAFAAFNAVLMDCSLCLDEYNFPGEFGCRTIGISDDCGLPIGYAYFSWYRMRSGRWEVIGYIT